MLTRDSASTLNAFIDNCNHKITNRLPLKETVNFNSFLEYGSVKIGINNKIKKHEEYAYSYSPNLSNEKFVYRYGGFIKDNPHSLLNIDIIFNKNNFNLKKYEICKDLKCFDQPLDNFYTQKETENLSLLISIGKLDIEKRLLDAIRLFTYSEEKLNKNEIIKRLTSGHWLNYGSEIRTYAFLKESLLNFMKKSMITYVIKFLLIIIIYF